MNDPEFFKRLHSFDQASTGFNTMATFLGAYFESLIVSGFTREEAFSLVKDYQKILLAQSFGVVVDGKNKQSNNEDDKDD
jgi:hypothetical protein